MLRLGMTPFLEFEARARPASQWLWPDKRQQLCNQQCNPCARSAAESKTYVQRPFFAERKLIRDVSPPMPNVHTNNERTFGIGRKHIHSSATAGTMKQGAFTRGVSC